MKKIININLSGRVIPIEDSAYESLQRYIESLRRYFANEEGRDEIINDIESRIAELMNDKVRKGATAVTDADIEEIINSMGRVEDFEKTDAEEKASAATGQTTGTYTQPQSEPRRAKGRLYRDGSDKFLGGVCAGIANYMNVDPAIVRLIFAIITFGGFGTGIIIYLALWIILPVKYLDTYVGKRLFRNPDDRVISGVAGGLGAYFNKPSWAFRLIFAAPLLLNILFGVLNGVFFMWQRDIFPNIFIGSFSGTFVLAYIILWIVLPEARSPFEKMEMRGEKVDVNRIKQNVQEGMGDFKNRMQSWGEEVKTTAQRMGSRAQEFARTQGADFASDFKPVSQPAGQGCLHAIGVIIKAFFIFIAGCITLALFAAFMAILFGGVAWWPINNFLWTSSIQKALAWGTLIFFIGVPIIGFMTWLIRRIVRVRSHSRYLGWIFGGLWTLGWVCAVFFAVSIAKDVREYQRVNAEVALTQPATGKLIVTVNEPEIHYSGGFGWLRHDNTGWDITDDTLKYNNVKFRISKSEDSLYHTTLSKYSFGSTMRDAQNRAERIVFNVSNKDSVLNLGSGLSVDHNSKFRGQGIIMEIQVPVGKRIEFDESLVHAYNPWVVRRGGREYRSYWRNENRYNIDWDYDDYFDWDPNVDYVMSTDGKLIRADKVAIDSTGVYEKKSEKNRLKELEEKEKKNEKERQDIEREKQRLQNQQPKTDSNSTGYKRKEKDTEVASLNLFSALII
jgi:phage shock protein PspC (stress-responsive transcriptional regulator)